MAHVQKRNGKWQARFRAPEGGSTRSASAARSTLTHG